MAASYPNYCTSQALPEHWIGVWKEWPLVFQSPLHALISLPPKDLRTHTLILGATGSGKTTLLHHLMAQDMLLGHSFAVLDLRGDLVTTALELCAGRVSPERLKLLDLREKQRPTGFNPLAGEGEPYFRALGVLSAVAAEADSWGVQLGESLRNALLLLAEAKAPLTKLEALFHSRQVRLQLLSRCRAENVVGFWQRFDELSPDRQASLAMPVLNKVSLLLATHTLRRILGHPQPMDLGSHLDTPGSILLASLAVDELHAAGRMMGKLLLSSISREIFARVTETERSRNPVRLYVDEFEHFGSEEFETILAEGRRFGFSLVLAHQTLAQLSPKLRSLILGNVGVKILFRLGREDGVTMSRDLTGDPKALDFASLETGDAVLWQRGEEPCLIEVNEPITHGGGRLSREAAALLSAVQELSAAPAEPELSEGPEEARPALEVVQGGYGAAREDWLCG